MNGGGGGRFKVTLLPPEKTTLKKPSPIRIKKKLSDGVDKKIVNKMYVMLRCTILKIKYLLLLLMLK